MSQVKPKKKYDLLSIGRSGVDLYGDQWGTRLEDVSSFSKSVGGCPANIAIGTSRLGLKVAMVTRVGDEQMGRYLKGTLEKEGVDTSYVITDKQRLTTVVFLSIKDEQTFPLLFYRTNCADMALNTEDIKEEAIKNSRAILFSGVHLSTPHTAQACFTALKFAKKHGARIIFDIDYRPTLWGLTGLGGGESRFVESAEVTANVQKVLPECDLIVGTEEEFNIAGGSQDIKTSLQKVRSLCQATLVYKMGARGCCVIPHEIPTQPISIGKSFAIRILNTIGAGDAFMSGFLRGYLKDEKWETCATWGNAAGALVVTRHACSPESPSWEELQFFIKNKLPSRPDEEPRFRHLHMVTTQKRSWENLKILAFDHRPQFEAMATAAKIKPEFMEKKIARAKQLIFESFKEVAQESNEGDFGLLCDQRYGNNILNQCADEDWWVACPVEKPHSRPLEFDFLTDISAGVRRFPINHIVKCLLFHHSEDEQNLVRVQLEQIIRLYEICMDTQHKFLLELIPPQGVGEDEAEIGRSMEQIYAAQVFPTWWKLPALPSQPGWDAVIKAIEKNDPHCSGILLLGLDKPIELLGEEFALARKQPYCKGFAVGRSIFSKACQAWFHKQIDDETAMKEINKNFRTMIDYWEKA